MTPFKSEAITLDQGSMFMIIENFILTIRHRIHNDWVPKAGILKLHAYFSVHESYLRVDFISVSKRNRK